MHDFKYYQVVTDIDFLNNKTLIGNYHTITNDRIEMKAIRKYKDAIWDIQGLMNNSIAIGKNYFEMIAHVTLYGVTVNDDYITMRHLELNM